MKAPRFEAHVLLLVLALFLATLALAMLAQLTCSRIDQRKFPAPGREIDIPGARMHVREMGDRGPTVVLESGIAASSLNWCMLQPRLAAFAKTSSYDRAGFGWSTTENRSCSLTRITDDLHALVRAVDLPVPFVLVAHSFGGYISRTYAQRFPQDLAGVVLVDPLTPEEWISPTRSQRWMLRRGIWFSRIGGVLAAFGVVRFCLWLLARGKSDVPKGVLASFGNKATETVARILRELLKLPPEITRVIRARWSTPKFFWTMAAYIQSLPRCAGELHDHPFPSDIPVTVLSGAHQTPERLAEHAAIANHSRRGRHLIAARGAHWIHLDQPELVVEAVREMLEPKSASLVLGDEKH